VTPVEFRGDLWRQKTTIPGLSCGVVCVILRLAFLVELRLVTDILTDLHNSFSGWRRGVVVSGVRRCMNEVNPRRARLVLGWVTVFGRVYHPSM